MAQVINDLSHPVLLIRKPQVAGSIPVAGSIFSVGYRSLARSNLLGLTP
jgi:hypothetical protein